MMTTVQQVNHRERGAADAREAPSRRRRLAAAALAPAGALALFGCANDAPQDTWQAAGPNAQKIDDLQRPVFYVAGVVGLIVFAVVGWVVFRFRDRGQAVPEQTHGKPALEVVLTILPVMILIGVGVPTVSVIWDLAKIDDTEMVINVTGQQWWWEYDYPAQGDFGIEAPIVTSGQLIIPEDTKVLLRITSRDVIHSYWIPKLNGKKDAVPGRVHTLRMEGSTPGIYAGQCTEFCGLSHANMRMEAVVLTRADFDTWIANQQRNVERLTVEGGATEAQLRGQDTFEQQCSRCHQVNGATNEAGDAIISTPETQVVAGAAPNLTHLMSRNTFAGASFDLLTEACRADVWEATPDEFGKRYLEGVTTECLNERELRAWIRNAPAMKPMYADPADAEDTGGRVRGMPYLALGEDQIDDLVAYLLELK